MKVFLSYHHTSLDEWLAEALARALATDGFEIFFDRDLRAGEKWSPEIQDQLESSHALIVLISRESAERPMVQREVLAAYEISQKRPFEILPVIIAGAEIPYELSCLDGFQHAAWDFGEDPAELASGLAEALRRAEERMPESTTAEAAPEIADTDAQTVAATGEDPEIAAYIAWALERHAGIDLIGLGAGEVKLRLDEVYVPLRIAWRAGFERQEHRTAIELEPAGGDVELEDILRSRPGGGPHAVVFGEPGAGKTTALKKLHQQCLSLGGERLGLPAGTLPVFLPLRRLRPKDRKKPLAEVLGRWLAEASGGKLPADLGDRLWRRGELLLLLDGLDEIGDDAERAKVAEYLEWQLGSSDPGGPRAVISCRYSGYGGGVELSERFLHLDVRPLDDDQMGRLIRLWFREAERVLPALTPDEAQAHASDLIEALGGEDYSSQQIKVLVSSPLLLTLLCVVVLRGGEMPRERVAFYDQCLRVLLGKWGQKTKGIKPLLDVETALAILRPLAWELHRGERRDDYSTPELVNHVRKRLADLGESASPFEVLAWLHREAGVLAEYSPQRFGFMHLGVQEYLAAAHAASRGEALLDELSESFGERWWREVVLLLLGMPGHRVFRSLMERVLRSDALLEHADLIRQGLTEAPEVDLEPFLAVLAGGDPERQAAVLRLLLGRCDPRLIEHARRLSESSSSDVKALAARLVAESEEGSADSPAATHDLFLAHLDEDAEAVSKLAERLRQRGTKLFEAPDWSASLKPLLETTRAVAVVVGDSGVAPWDRAELRACLELFAGEERPLVPVLLPGAKEMPQLPKSLSWAPWVDLHAGIDAAGCEAIEQAVASTKTAAAAPSLRVTEGPAGGEAFRERLTGMQMLWVPGGRFEMGGEDIQNSRPVHEVELSPFWLGETPVTNGQYGVFLEKTGAEEPRFWRDRRFSDAEQPVVGVSWEEATAFCDWLTEVHGLRWRLPSEAQWEYAARGGDGREYPWGNEKPDATRACFGLDWSKDQPALVGSCPAGRGPFGTLDQAGNVWEWCADVWDEKAYGQRQAVAVDPVVMQGEEDFRVLRGGGWDYSADGLRSAVRVGNLASGRGDVFGFRVLAAPAKPTQA